MLHHAYIGKSMAELPTPVLLVDLDALDHNIATMQSFANQKGLALRPHIKAHKSPKIAHLQMTAGAVGVTCAKLSEAIVMWEAGIGDILLANQVVSQEGIEILCGLNRYGSVAPCVDSIANAEEISRIAVENQVVVPVFLEVHAGLGRCGVRTLEEGIALGEAIAKLSGIRLKGIQSYEARPVDCHSPEDCYAFSRNALALAASVKEALLQRGIGSDLLSSSCTGTAVYTAEAPGVTELQPGSYPLMETIYDPNQIGLPFQQAAFVLASVVSRHGDRIILNAGEKAVTVDQGMPQLELDPSIKITLHEEHSLFDATAKTAHLAVGDKVRFIPSHCCTTSNQHPCFFGVRGGKVETIFNITAAGKYL